MLTMPPSWTHLLAVAREEIHSMNSDLPPELKQAAEIVPITFDPRRDEELRHLDLDGTLGLFVGKSRLEAAEEGEDVPAQIILFLANLWDFAEGDEAIYRREVRTTFLHELGHFLGLDEIDLEERGL
jgi:predicted Zn-dependent protease with MMP-like domain